MGLNNIGVTLKILVASINSAAVCEPDIEHPARDRRLQEALTLVIEPGLLRYVTNANGDRLITR